MKASDINLSNQEWINLIILIMSTFECKELVISPDVIARCEQFPSCIDVRQPEVKGQIRITIMHADLPASERVH